MAYLRPLQTLDKPNSYALGTSQTVYRGQVVSLYQTDTLAYGTYASGNAVIAGLSMDNIASSIYEKLIATYTTTINVDASGNGTATSIATGKTFKGSDMDATTFASLAGWTLTAKTSSESKYSEVTTSEWKAATDVDAGTITITAVSATDYANETGVSLSLTAVLDILKSGDGFTSVEDQFNNSTEGSGKVTVYWSEGIYETDQYNPLVAYLGGSPLYVDGNGILTSGTSSVMGSGAAAPITVGHVLRAPSLALTAETRVTSGHNNPVPESLQLYFRKPVTLVSQLTS